MLYGCDLAWWQKYDGVMEFDGLKISHDGHRFPPGWGIDTVHIVKQDDRIRLDKFGIIGWGGNSGFHALNLAVQFGVKRIILVGYDMHLDAGLHWHGRHPQGLNNPTTGNVARWRNCIDAAAPVMREIGVEVLNASPISALKNYEKVDFASAIGA